MESSTSNLMLKMKFLLISIGAISSAIAIKSSVPLILYEFPTIWTGLISWMKPPYLYVLLNGIIIIIAATSRSNRKEQQHSGEQSESLISAGTPPVMENLVEISRSKMSEYAPELVDEPEVFEVMPLISAGTPPVNSDLVAINRSEMCEYASEVVDEPEVFEEKTEPVIEPPEVNEDESENDEFVISNSVFTPLPEVETELIQQLATEKPLVSSRFSHRKPLMRTSPEGMKSLRVARVKRQETLESTWKKITEGRHKVNSRYNGTCNSPKVNIRLLSPTVAPIPQPMQLLSFSYLYHSSVEGISHSKSNFRSKRIGQYCSRSGKTEYNIAIRFAIFHATI